MAADARCTASSGAFDVIDAHLHIWQLGRHGQVWPGAGDGLLYRDHPIEEALSEARAAGVARGVLVQTQEDIHDTQWLLDTADAHEFVLAVAGWVDLVHADADRHLDQLAAASKSLRSIRPMVQHRPADWLDDPRLDPALRRLAALGLRFEALVMPQHLASLIRVADRHPGLLVILNHAAKPDLTQSLDDHWVQSIAAIAARPNVVCKLSGLLTETPAPPEPAILARCVDVLLMHFGPRRLLWGSDWPVVKRRADYRGWLDLARNLVPPEHRGAIFEANALRCYGSAAWA